MKKRFNKFHQAWQLEQAFFSAPRLKRCCSKLFTISSSTGLKKRPSKFKEIVMNIELLYWEALM